MSEDGAADGTAVADPSTAVAEPMAAAGAAPAAAGVFTAAAASADGAATTAAVATAAGAAIAAVVAVVAVAVAASPARAPAATVTGAAAGSAGASVTPPGPWTVAAAASGNFGNWNRGFGRSGEDADAADGRSCLCAPRPSSRPMLPLAPTSTVTAALDGEQVPSRAPEPEPEPDPEPDPVPLLLPMTARGSGSKSSCNCGCGFMPGGNSYATLPAPAKPTERISEPTLTTDSGAFADAGGGSSAAAAAAVPAATVPLAAVAARESACMLMTWPLSAGCCAKALASATSSVLGAHRFRR